MHRFEPFTILKFFSKKISDKNECSLYKACQYECINAVGSYKCTCPPGYELQPSGKCKGKKKSTRNFLILISKKNSYYLYKILMNAKPEIMHVHRMKSATIPEAVTNVSIWDVRQGTNRYLRVQQIGTIIFRG